MLPNRPLAHPLTGGALILALAGLTACGGEAESPDSSAAAPPVEYVSEASPEDLEAGAAVYEKAACFSCHGRGGKGALAGPELENLAANWNAEDLAAFISDPVSWAEKDERIAAMATQYPLPMARPIRPITTDDRMLLAEWLLTL